MFDSELKLWIEFPPGRDLAEKLEEMNLDANDLAARMGYTPKAVNDILQGNCRITTEVAFALEMVTEIPADYWLRSQIAYDEFVTREKIKASLTNQSLWKKSFPSEVNVREWVRQGDDAKSLMPLLKFFAVASPQAWDNYYKKAQLKAALPEIIAFAAANKTLPKRAKKITYTTPEAEVWMTA